MASGSGTATTFTAYDVPLSAVLKWPTGNFTHPERRHWFVPYAATIQVLTTLVIVARLWTRLGKRAGGLGTDDWLIVTSFLFASAVTGVGIYGVLDGGLDRHVWDVVPAIASRAGLVGWITEIFFLLSLCICKVSVLLFFRRLIDRTNNRVLSQGITGAIIFTIAYFFAYFFFLIFACSPVDAAWKSLNITWTGKYKCVHRKNVDLSNGVLSVFSDCYALAIPVIIVSKLTLPWDRKVMLYGVFCCGLIVIGAGIARTYYLVRMFTDPRRDLTSVGYDLLVWGLLEIHLALICASAPAMKGFFRKLSETVGSGYAGYGYGSKNGSGGPRSRARSGAKLGETYNLTPLSALSHSEQQHWSDSEKTWSRNADFTDPPHAITTTAANLEPPGPTYPPQTQTACQEANPSRQHSQRGRLQRGQKRGDYVQLDSNGIHVTQRWSVTSHDPYANEGKARRMLGAQ